MNEQDEALSKIEKSAVSAMSTHLRQLANKLAKKPFYAENERESQIERAESVAEELSELIKEIKKLKPYLNLTLKDN
tara:strand:- start:8 stop:238 length:231 start_codon:yes stop_codon:yes gene_type:complete